MRKSLLLVLISVAPGIVASENQIGDVSSQPSADSYLSCVTSCLNYRWIGAAALACLGAYGVYRYLATEIEKEEERVFQEHTQEPETFTVSEKDSSKVHLLIEAMEEDIIAFQTQPIHVQSLQLSDFDDEEMANGCEGVRSAFCVLYEQSVQHPENKPFLDEFVMIFRQAIEQAMIVV